MEFKFWDMVDLLTGARIATRKEIDLVCAVAGYNKRTLESILHVRAGENATFEEINRVLHIT